MKRARKVRKRRSRLLLNREGKEAEMQIPPHKNKKLYNYLLKLLALRFS
jgi:hypothetical protein